MSNANQKPVLNTWDIPEIMPGAHPSCSNPAQKEEFQTRCEDIWNYQKKNDRRDARLERNDKAKLCQQQMDQLNDMFPNIDKELVTTLFMDAWGQSQGDALTKTAEQLLQLNDAGAGNGKINIDSTTAASSSASKEATEQLEQEYTTENRKNLGDYFPADKQRTYSSQSGNQNTSASPGKDRKNTDEEKNLMVAKTEAFPVLTDKDGWQVLGAQQLKEMGDPNAGVKTLEEVEEEENKPNWAATAKAAKDLPAPPSTIISSPQKLPYGAKKRPGKNANADEDDGDMVTEEYDLRQQLGKKREKKFAKKGEYCPDDVDLENEMMAEEAGNEDDSFEIVNDA